MEWTTKYLIIDKHTNVVGRLEKVRMAYAIEVRERYSLLLSLVDDDWLNTCTCVPRFSRTSLILFLEHFGVYNLETMHNL